MVKILKATYSIDENIDPLLIMQNIETAGKTCYRVEHTITDDSYDSFIRMIIKRGHESVLEHEKVTVRVVCDRGVTHEWVRHRIASYSQESTRYCDYSKGKFGGEITVIDISEQLEKSLRKEGMHSGGISFVFNEWRQAMEHAEKYYKRMTELGCTPEFARSVLPNSLKTEIVVTMNMREWRHFFKLRTSKRAHPQIREIAVPLLEDFKELFLPIFEDIQVIE